MSQGPEESSDYVLPGSDASEGELLRALYRQILSVKQEVVRSRTLMQNLVVTLADNGTINSDEGQRILDLIR